MAKLKENGNLAMNARINIKYNSEKPKVSFSYPDKKTQLKGSMFEPIRGVLLLFASITGFFQYIQDPERFLLWVAFYVLFFYTVLPAIIYFPFKKQWDKLYPKYQSFTARKKYHKFLPSEVIETNGRIFVELPVFSNVVCDFKCSKDFSDYLEEIDIREHKFTSVKLSKFGKKKLNKKQKKKRRVNEFLWYARFYFSKKPTKGNMEVIFK